MRFPRRRASSKKSVEATECHFVENRHNSDESDNGINCSHWMFHSLSIIGPLWAWPDNASPALFCPATLQSGKARYKSRLPQKRTRKRRLSTLVGAAGFEPTTPCPPDKCATGLRYAPSISSRRWRVVLRRSGTIEAHSQPINGPGPGKTCFKADGSARRLSFVYVCIQVCFQSFKTTRDARQDRVLVHLRQRTRRPRVQQRFWQCPRQNHHSLPDRSP